MPELIPRRPRYARERALFGYPVLAAFLLLFAAKLAGKHLSFDLGAFGSAPLLLALFLPVLLFLLLRGREVFPALRVHRLYAAHIPLLLAAFVALLSGTLLLSAVCGGMETLGNSVVTYAAALPDGALARLAALPLFALLPAVLEEVLFRGILGAELCRRGMLRTVIVSALLFALCRFDLRNLPAYLFMGAVLTLTLYATDTLLSAVLLHGLYAALALFFHRYWSALYRVTGSLELLLFLLLFVLLVSLLFFSLECSRLYRARVGVVPPPRRDIPRRVQFYTMIDALSEWPVLFSILLAVVGFFIL